jgi:hypothetical protein
MFQFCGNGDESGKPAFVWGLLRTILWYLDLLLRFDWLLVLESLVCFGRVDVFFTQLL